MSDRPRKVPHADALQELGRLRALIAHSVDPLDLLDRDGRVLYSSPSRERPLGHPDGHLGRSALELVHADDFGRVMGEFDELRNAPGTTLRSEFRARHADGSWRWVDATATNLLDEPEVGAIVLSLRDVTERKRAEAELHLSQRLASIGILAAGVGHEINNPLAFVTSVLHSLDARLARLRSDAATDGIPEKTLAELQEGVDLARNGAQRIAGIVKGLRLLSGPETTEIHRVDVAQVLESTLAVTRGSLPIGVALEVHSEGAPHALSDELRLGQVLLNLVSNAAQAIPEGRKDGRIEIHIGTATPGTVVIEMRDNGVGIAPEHLPHVFDPFFTTKPRDLGIGLGLSISRRIVDALGGRIEVESSLGNGSTFRVTLPAAPQGSPSPVPAEPASRERPRLLIIDDEPNLVSVLISLLQPEYDVQGMTDAADAARAVGAGTDYDVVLCDLMMIGMTGADFHAIVASARPELASRIVFMTGGAFTPDARAFLERVPNPCMRKPLDFERLQRVLRDCARRSAARSRTLS